MSLQPPVGGGSSPRKGKCCTQRTPLLTGLAPCASVYCAGGLGTRSLRIGGLCGFRLHTARQAHLLVQRPTDCTASEESNCRADDGHNGRSHGCAGSRARPLACDLAMSL